MKVNLILLLIAFCSIRLHAEQFVTANFIAKKAFYGPDIIVNTVTLLNSEQHEEFLKTHKIEVVDSTTLFGFCGEGGFGSREVTTPGQSIKLYLQDRKNTCVRVQIISVEDENVIASSDWFKYDTERYGTSTTTQINISKNDLGGYGVDIELAMSMSLISDVDEKIVVLQEAYGRIYPKDTGLYHGIHFSKPRQFDSPLGFLPNGDIYLLDSDSKILVFQKMLEDSSMACVLHPDKNNEYITSRLGMDTHYGMNSNDFILTQQILPNEQKQVRNLPGNVEFLLHAKFRSAQQVGLYSITSRENEFVLTCYSNHVGMTNSDLILNVLGSRVSANYFWPNTLAPEAY
ncbi:MAG: hypothetical protein KDD40_08905 [Bdellovibrionales bacterium]|nr:hypothetical protein [Bdellovibrionales bacterium]